MANLLSGVASAERVFELLDTPEEIADPVDPQVPAEWHGRVEFEKASFRYLPEQPLIDDLSLVAEPGHTVAIVGPDRRRQDHPGQPDHALLRARRRPDHPRRRRHRRHDAGRPAGERRNGAAGHLAVRRHHPRQHRLRPPDATEEEILEAARATFVDRFVHSLPDGYDTVIDEEGNNISAGERQLLTIARAFLADPSLLILDEATSSVDTRTELAPAARWRRCAPTGRRFVIAHRLSTIRDADLILVMEAGRIVEQGNHEQLLAARGAYHRLYSAQFRGAADEEAAAETPEPVIAGRPETGCWQPLPDQSGCHGFAELLAAVSLATDLAHDRTRHKRSRRCPPLLALMGMPSTERGPVRCLLPLRSLYAPRLLGRGRRPERGRRRRRHQRRKWLSEADFTDRAALPSPECSAIRSSLPKARPGRAPSRSSWRSDDERTSAARAAGVHADLRRGALVE